VKRQMVADVMTTHELSQRRACGLIGITRRGFQRKPAEDRNRELRQRLRELAEQRRRWGCPKLYIILRREGWRANHKRIERLYREEGLSLKLRRRRRKRLSHLRVPRERPVAANQTWAVDFIHDSLSSGRRFRAFAVLDEWSRESLAIEVDVSLPGERVTRVLGRLHETRGLPVVIQADNGPELRGQTLDQWAHDHGVHLQFIERGKPIQNAYIESFNARLREECLNEHVFVSLDDARRKIEQWRIAYKPRTPTFQPGQPEPRRVRSVGQRARERNPRAHRWASERKAEPSAAMRSGCRSKTRQFFRPPYSEAKGGLKNCDRKLLSPTKMNQTPATTNLRMGYQKG
jgi:putative transposase